MLNFNNPQEIGGHQILAADKLSGFNKSKPKRTRKEPKLYVVDNMSGQKFAAPEETDESGNVAAEMTLAQAIDQGLVKEGQVDKSIKVALPKDPNPPPVPVGPSHGLTQDHIDKAQEVPFDEATGQPIITGQGLPSDIPMLDVPPLPTDRPVPSIVDIHPGSGEIPEDLLKDLIMSIKAEKAAGHSIKVLDQDGNEINGLTIVRPSSPNMSMF